MRVPTCEQKHFHICVQWLYSGRLYVSNAGTLKNAVAKNNLMRGYLLGEYLEDVNYKDCLIDSVRKWVGNSSSRDCELLVLDYAQEVFRDTSTEAPMRNLLVDAAV